MKLTILTVSYGHRALLLENVRLSTTLHRDFFSQVAWYVAENSPPDHPDRFHGDESGLIVREANSETGFGISHHHASALNHLLRTTPLTDYVLILDPDFFLLFPDWAEQIPNHMAQRGLSFFGVPWHPRHNQNYRYFPAVHCFAFDSRRVPVNTLDFTPRLDHLAWRETTLARLIGRIPILGYRLISTAWDTGSKIQRRYGADSSYPVEVVTPVYSADPLYLSAKNRLVEACLPDPLCLVPKRHGYYTELGFVDRGWVDASPPEQWESFVWCNRPFGLHVRRSFASHVRDESSELAQLPILLAQLRAASQPTHDAHDPTVGLP